MSRKLITTAICSGLLCAGLLVTPSAKADQWDQKTIVTFSAPVEVPGTVLPAGTYVMKLADSQSDRHIVQILNARQNHVCATILAIPDERLRPAGKTEITFYEMPAGQPQALRSWFYPGDLSGQEFAYPRSKATEISRVTHENVPVMPANSVTGQVAIPGN